MFAQMSRFGRAAPLPVPPARPGVRIDTTRAEHLLGVHNNRDRGNRLQVVLDRRSIAPTETITPTLADHIRIHPVICRGPSPALREPATPGGRRILLDDVVEKDIGLGVDVGRLQSLSHRHGPQGGGAVNQ